MTDSSSRETHTPSAPSRSPEQPTSAWRSREGRLVIGAAVLAIGVIATAILAYVVEFGSWEFSPNHQRWSEFGGFLSAFIAISTTMATIAVGIAVSIIFPRALERQAEVERRARVAADLSKDFFSRPFYLEIIVPAWEIASKWISWQSRQGDDYRYQVLGGQFLFEPCDFLDEKDANRVLFQNRIHFEHHFAERDGDEQRLNWNEHMILSMWVRFWASLELACQNNTITDEHAQNNFANFYEWWLRFMRQMWMVKWLLLRSGSPPSQWDHEKISSIRGKSHWDIIPSLEIRLLGRDGKAKYDDDLARAKEIFGYTIRRLRIDNPQHSLFDRPHIKALVEQWNLQMTPPESRPPNWRELIRWPFSQGSSRASASGIGRQ